MRLAAQIGLPLSELWDMTAHELAVYAGAYIERREAETKAAHQRDTLQAYLISRWVWQKRVDIRKYLSPQEAKQPMTDKQMYQRMLALNAALGGRVEGSDGFGGVSF